MGWSLDDWSLTDWSLGAISETPSTPPGGGFVRPYQVHREPVTAINDDEEVLILLAL